MYHTHMFKHVSDAIRHYPPKQTPHPTPPSLLPPSPIQRKITLLASLFPLQCRVRHGPFLFLCPTPRIPFILFSISLVQFLCVLYSASRGFQDEALDSEGPRLAFEKMAKEVNQLAAAAAANAGAGAPPPAVKTADDVSVASTPPSRVPSTTSISCVVPISPFAFATFWDAQGTKKPLEVFSVAVEMLFAPRHCVGLAVSRCGMPCGVVLCSVVQRSAARRGAVYLVSSKHGNACNK